MKIELTVLSLGLLAEIPGSAQPQSGIPLWIYDAGAVITGSPGVARDGTVYIGSTTIWERWNGWLSGPGGGYAPPYSSFNQVWNGAVGEWIFRVVAGINRDPLKPGFENVLIEPQPGGDVTNAFASFGSIRGIITTSWTNTVSGFDLTIRVPANTTADVSLPTATLQNINEGSSAATNAPGVMTFWLTNSMSVFRVGSGSYDFHVNY